MKKIFLVLFLILSFRGASVYASTESGIIGPDLIQKEQYQILTLSDILSFYSSTSGGVSITEDNYTGNGAILGTHSLELGISGTQNRRTINIQVVDQIGYSVRAVTDLKDIHVAKNVKLNPQDFVQIHSRTGLFRLNHTSQMSILSNKYTGNETTPGVYLIEYRIMDASGLDQVISFNTTVYDSERLETPIIVIPKEPGFFDQISSGIQTIISIAVFAGLGLGVLWILKKVKR